MLHLEPQASLTLDRHAGFDACWWVQAGKPAEQSHIDEPSAVLLASSRTGAVKAVADVGGKPHPAKKWDGEVEGFLKNATAVNVSRNGKFIVAAGTKGKKGGFVVLWSAAGGLRRLHRDPPRAAAAAAAAGSPPPLTVGADPGRPPQAVAVNDAGTTALVYVPQAPLYLWHGGRWYALPSPFSTAPTVPPALSCCFLEAHPVAGTACRFTAVRATCWQLPAGVPTPAAVLDSATWDRLPWPVLSKSGSLSHPVPAATHPQHPMHYLAVTHPADPSRRRSGSAPLSPASPGVEGPAWGEAATEWHQALVVTDLCVSFANGGGGDALDGEDPSADRDGAPPQDVTEGFSAAGHLLPFTVHREQRFAALQAIGGPRQHEAPVHTLAALDPTSGLLAAYVGAPYHYLLLHSAAQPTGVMARPPLPPGVEVAALGWAADGELLGLLCSDGRAALVSRAGVLFKLTDPTAAAPGTLPPPGGGPAPPRLSSPRGLPGLAGRDASTPQRVPPTPVSPSGGSGGLWLQLFPGLGKPPKEVHYSLAFHPRRPCCVASNGAAVSAHQWPRATAPVASPRRGLPDADGRRVSVTTASTANGSSRSASPLLHQHRPTLTPSLLDLDRLLAVPFPAALRQFQTSVRELAWGADTRPLPATLARASVVVDCFLTAALRESSGPNPGPGPGPEAPRRCRQAVVALEWAEAVLNGIRADSLRHALLPAEPLMGTVFMGPYWLRLVSAITAALVAEPVPTPAAVRELRGLLAVTRGRTPGYRPVPSPPPTPPALAAAHGLYLQGRWGEAGEAYLTLLPATNQHLFALWLLCGDAESVLRLALPQLRLFALQPRLTAGGPWGGADPTAGLLAVVCPGLPDMVVGTRAVVLGLAQLLRHVLVEQSCYVLSPLFCDFSPDEGSDTPDPVPDLIVPFSTTTATDSAGGPARRYYVPLEGPRLRSALGAMVGPEGQAERLTLATMQDFAIDLWLAADRPLEALHLCLLFAALDRALPAAHLACHASGGAAGGGVAPKAPFHRGAEVPKRGRHAARSSAAAYTREGLVAMPCERTTFESYEACRRSWATADMHRGTCCLYCLRTLLRLFALRAVHAGDTATLRVAFQCADAAGLGSALRRQVAAQYIVLLRHAVAVAPPLLLPPLAGPARPPPPLAAGLRDAVQHFPLPAWRVAPPAGDDAEGSTGRSLQPCTTLADFLQQWVSPPAQAGVVHSPRAAAAPAWPDASLHTRAAALRESGARRVLHLAASVLWCLTGPGGAPALQALFERYRSTHGPGAADGAPPAPREFRLLCRYLWLVHVRERAEEYLRRAADASALPADPSDSSSSSQGDGDQVDGAHPSRPAPEAPTEQVGLKAAKWVVALLPFCEDTHCQAVLQDTVLAVLGRAPASKRLARLLAEHLDYEATVTGCKGKWHGLQTRLVEHNPKLQAVFDEWAAHHRRVREAEDGAAPQRAASRPRPAASVALSADSVGQRAWAMAVAPLGCCDGPGHLEPDGEDDDGGGEELWPFEHDPRYWGALAAVFAGADPPSPPPALPPADVLGCQPLYTLSALMGRYGGPSVDVQLVQWPPREDEEPATTAEGVSSPEPTTRATPRPATPERRRVPPPTATVSPPRARSVALPASPARPASPQRRPNGMAAGPQRSADTVALGRSTDLSATLEELDQTTLSDPAAPGGRPSANDSQVSVVVQESSDEEEDRGNSPTAPPVSTVPHSSPAAATVTPRLGEGAPRPPAVGAPTPGLSASRGVPEGGRPHRPSSATEPAPADRRPESHRAEVGAVPSPPTLAARLPRVAPLTQTDLDAPDTARSLSPPCQDVPTPHLLPHAYLAAAATATPLTVRSSPVADHLLPTPRLLPLPSAQRPLPPGPLRSHSPPSGSLADPAELLRASQATATPEKLPGGLRLLTVSVDRLSDWAAPTSPVAVRLSAAPTPTPAPDPAGPLPLTGPAWGSGQQPAAAIRSQSMPAAVGTRTAETAPARQRSSTPPTVREVHHHYHGASARRAVRHSGSGRRPRTSHRRRSTPSTSSPASSRSPSPPRQAWNPTNPPARAPPKQDAGLQVDFPAPAPAPAAAPPAAALPGPAAAVTLMPPAAMTALAYAAPQPAPVLLQDPQWAGHPYPQRSAPSVGPQGCPLDPTPRPAPFVAQPTALGGLRPHPHPPQPMVQLAPQPSPLAPASRTSPKQRQTPQLSVPQRDGSAGLPTRYPTQLMRLPVKRAGGDGGPVLLTPPCLPSRKPRRPPASPSATQFRAPWPPIPPAGVAHAAVTQEDADVVRGGAPPTAAAVLSALAEAVQRLPEAVAAAVTAAQQQQQPGPAGGRAAAGGDEDAVAGTPRLTRAPKRYADYIAEYGITCGERDPVPNLDQPHTEADTTPAKVEKAEQPRTDVLPDPLQELIAQQRVIQELHRQHLELSLQQQQRQQQRQPASPQPRDIEADHRAKVDPDSSPGPSGALAIARTGGHRRGSGSDASEEHRQYVRRLAEEMETERTLRRIARAKREAEEAEEVRRLRVAEADRQAEERRAQRLRELDSPTSTAPAPAHAPVPAVPADQPPAAAPAAGRYLTVAELTRSTYITDAQLHARPSVAVLGGSSQPSTGAATDLSLSLLAEAPPPRAAATPADVAAAAGEAALRHAMVDRQLAEFNAQLCSAERCAEAIESLLARPPAPAAPPAPADRSAWGPRGAAWPGTEVDRLLAAEADRIVARLEPPPPRLDAARDPPWRWGGGGSLGEAKGEQWPALREEGGEWRAVEDVAGDQRFLGLPPMAEAAPDSAAHTFLMCTDRQHPLGHRGSPGGSSGLPTPGRIAAPSSGDPSRMEADLSDGSAMHFLPRSFAGSERYPEPAPALVGADSSTGLGLSLVPELEGAAPDAGADPAAPDVGADTLLQLMDDVLLQRTSPPPAPVIPRLPLHFLHGPPPTRLEPAGTAAPARPPVARPVSASSSAARSRSKSPANRFAMYNGPPLPQPRPWQPRPARPRSSTPPLAPGAARPGPPAGGQRPPSQPPPPQRRRQERQRADHLHQRLDAMHHLLVS